MARKFLDEKGVSTPQKLGDFFKKMVTENNDFIRKNPSGCNPYLTLMFDFFFFFNLFTYHNKGTVRKGSKRN